jgi:hypothetical protein
MKSSILSSLAVLALALCTSHLRADTFDLSLSTDGNVDIPLQAVTLNGVGATTFTYTNTTVCALGIGGCTSLLGTSTSAINITYADVSPDLATLSVTDICTHVVVAGSAPNCQDFAFSVTNVVLGNGQVGVGAAAGVLALADVDLGVGAAGITINGSSDTPELLGAGVNGAGDQFQFTAATPEPASLSLLATGLATTAGMVRRRMRRSA